MVMELCEGGELSELILQEQLSEQRIAHILQKILSAVSYMHSRNIMHRDLKPANLMFESHEQDAQIKVADFGCGKISKGVVYSALVGTLLYMAPEVLDMNAPYTVKCDVWSIGVIAFEMFTGRRPFNGARYQDFFAAIKRNTDDTGNIGEWMFGPLNGWVGRSIEAKSFVRFLLHPNPVKRASTEEALQSEWLNSYASPEDNELVVEKSKEKVEIPMAGVRASDAMLPKQDSGTLVTRSIVSALVAFSQFSKLKQAALIAVAFDLEGPEISAIRDSFNRVDSGNNGRLTQAELASCLAEHRNQDPSLTEQLCKEVFLQMDQDQSGTINYLEFLGATISYRRLQDPEIQKAFDHFDVDHTKTITVNNLLQVGLGRHRKAAAIKMIKEADLNGDLELTFDEFKRILLEHTPGIEKASWGDQSV